MKRNIAVVMLVVILAVINVSIYSKEKHLIQGNTIYLELAPVDPRSLMQGDYMALRFTLANQLYKTFPKVSGLSDWQDIVAPHEGKIVVNLDSQKVASYKAIYQGQTLQENELTLHYRVRNNKVMFASNAFFFEEGTAEIYQSARYGEFKVNAQGELLLNAMFDKQLMRLTSNAISSN